MDFMTTAIVPYNRNPGSLASLDKKVSSWRSEKLPGPLGYCKDNGNKGETAIFLTCYTCRRHLFRVKVAITCRMVNPCNEAS